MPTPAEALSPATGDEEYRQAVSACIRQLIEEGIASAQARAICVSQAETAVGRPYPRASRRRGVKVTGAGVQEIF